MSESGTMNGESHRYNTRSKTRQDSLTSSSDIKTTAVTTAGQKSPTDPAVPGPDTASDVIQPSSATSAMSAEDQLMSGTQPNPPPPTREQTSSVETGGGDENDEDDVTMPSSTISTLPSSSQTKSHKESQDEMTRRVSNTPSMSSASGGLPKGLRRVPRKVDLAAARDDVPEDDDEESPHDQVQIVRTGKRGVRVSNNLWKGTGGDARDNDDEEGVMKAESEEISGSGSSGRRRSSGAGAGGERLRRTSTGASVDHYAQVLADPSSKVPAGGG